MRWLLLLTLYSVLGTPYSSAADKPVPTKDAAARMTVPEGFRVTLFAGEPDVVQPIAFTFDDRGRMWVVECLSYPKWRHDGKGNDRVVILEDTDGDGVHDKKTVFLDNGSNLSGIELGFGGVWLCSSPNLIFIPVRDDRPAGPPEVVLDGWNVKDTKHNVFNSLAWGPDGWLYGCNGIQAKAAVGRPGTPPKDRTYMDCGVWRYHPTRKTFEVFAHGTTNPWGLDWDEYGELFITNCVIDHLWYVVPGGHYQRMYGQDLNPYTFGLMGPASDHKHWAGGHWTGARADQKTGAVQKGHSDAGGGHAHSGCCVYLGDSFPPEYRNSVFTCNLHGNRLNRDSLHRTADRGYVGRHEADFLFANDPWFRGICVKQGPEGALYVSDWCDTGECHNYDVADTTNGRIYRVSYGSPKPFQGDMSKMADEELVKLQLSKNEWLVRKARRVLQERFPVSGGAGLQLFQIAETGFKDRDPRRNLRMLWAAHAIAPGQLGVKPRDLDHPQPHMRAWSVRLGLDYGTPSGKFVAKLAEVAATEQSPLVRRAIASGMQRLPALDGLKLATALFNRDTDNGDPDLTLLYWYGVQPAVLSKPEQALELVNKVRVERVRTNIVRLVLTLPDADPTRQLEQVLPVLVAAPDDASRRDILLGIQQAFEDRSQVKPPLAWSGLYPKLAVNADAQVRELAEGVALLFGDERAVAALKQRLADQTAPADARRQAVERLAAKKLPGLAPILRDLLADPAVRGAAVRALAAYPDPATPAAVLKAYPSLTAAEKADAVQTLASRKEFADQLLDALAAGTVPKADVTAFAARQILALNDKAVIAKLTKVWGTVKPASATRAAQTARLKALLTPDAVKAADLPHGRAIYARSCAACHKLFGEGGDVGPELTGSQRANLDYVLENVLDPNAVVPFDYKMTAFHLADGRVITGLVKKETPQAVTVRTANEAVIIPVADIESRKPTPHSVMPEGLLDALADDDVRDLIAYLAAKEQVPLKEEKK